MKKPNETDFYANATEHLISFNYNNQRTRANSNYSGWVDTKSNALLILYDPPKGKNIILSASKLEVFAF